jgi:hypothetical protein
MLKPRLRGCLAAYSSGQAITEQLGGTAVPSLDVADRIADGLAVEEGDPGDESAIQGLATLVMRKVFAPEAIDGAATDVLAS